MYMYIWHEIRIYSMDGVASSYKMLKGNIISIKSYLWVYLQVQTLLSVADAVNTTRTLI